VIDQRLLDLLLKSNIQYTEAINKALMGDPVLGMLTDKQIAIASLIYSAGMANLTELKTEDFITLALYAYNNVDVTPNGPPNEEGPVGNA
jgi:hypothetical protein